MRFAGVPFRRALLLAVAALALGFPAPAGAGGGEPPSPNGGDAAAACDASIGGVPVAGGRACQGVEGIGWNAADACRSHTPLGAEECARFDGRVVAESEVQAYESSWVHRALTQQRRLDDSAPLLRSLWPHTHNSFNAFAYDATLTGLDSNHVYSMRDQLRMDMRAIEMDIHWAPSIHGSMATGGRAVVLCHGESAATPLGPVHAGCSNDRPFAHGLVELRSWLDEPANADEVVLLYLQNELDGDPLAHSLAAAEIDTHLGGLVYRPAAGEPCAPLPLETSRAAIRSTGARVVLAGNCGPGAWGTWVFERGPRWHEESSGWGDDYGAAGCAAERAAGSYDTRWIRRWEDATRVSYWTGRGGDVTVTETARMVACGVNMVGFDQLVPSDPRLEALVWSWAPDEPLGAGCAASRPGDARFVVRSCGDSLPAVCRTGAGQWAVTSAAVGWADGGAACAAEFPGSWFAVPANGWENSQVAAAKAAAGAPWAWLSHSV